MYAFLNANRLLCVIPGKSFDLLPMKTLEIFEGARAAQYDAAISYWIPAYHEFHTFIASHLQQNFSTDDPLSILIAGCGTGREIKEVNLSPQWHITAFDPSVEMIRQAITQYGKYPNIALVQGTIEAIEKDDFEIATLILVLHFLSDDGAKFDLLSKICQRLKANGRLLLVDVYHSEDFDEQLLLLQARLQSHFDPDWIQQGIHHIKNDIFHITEARLNQLIKNAGFSSVERFKKSYFYGGWIIRK